MGTSAQDPATADQLTELSDTPYEADSPIAINLLDTNITISPATTARLTADSTAADTVDDPSLLTIATLRASAPGSDPFAEQGGVGASPETGHAATGLLASASAAAASLTSDKAASASYTLGPVKWGPSQTFGTTGGVVTWSLVPTVTAINPELGGGLATTLSQFLYNGFEAELKAAFAAWSAIANIQFIQVVDGGGSVGSGTVADIRIFGASIDGQDNALAGGVMPGNGAPSGEIVFDRDDAFFFTPHTFFLTAAHEIGHAIGLDHSSNPSALMYDFLNENLSGLQSDDIAGAQAIYGAAQPGTAKTYNLPNGHTTLTILTGAPNVVINGNNSGNTITGTDFSETINGGSGNDIFNGGAGSDTLAGNAGNDVLNGGDGADTLSGGLGNDTLNGGTGSDSLTGGDGDDLYIVDSSGDTVAENVSAGNDHVQSSVTFTLSADVENLTLTGEASINGTGNALDNVISGNFAPNILTGGAGNDTLKSGGALNGVDTMIGGSGDDTYWTNHASDIVIELSDEGVDTIYGGSVVLPDNVENATAFPNTSGSADFRGNSLDNVLTGGAFSDYLDGGAGADTLIGKGADDTYTVDNVGDIVIENANEGTDRINASVSYTLSANVENLRLTASGITGTGNALDNTLSTTASNTTLAGGAGNDIYDIQSAPAGTTTIVENSNEGIDTVISLGSHTLGVNIENLQIVGWNTTGIGNSLDNMISASGQNVTLMGGQGNDTYNVVASATIIENLNEGIDTVQSAESITLGANIENLVLLFSSSANGTGNSLDNLIVGNLGANILDGGAGIDTLVGGRGDDTYVIDNLTDTIIEYVGEGTDRLFSSVSVSAIANVEEIWLMVAGLTATGDASANTLVANANNSTLLGGLGDDTYTIKAGVTGTTIVENDGEGTDTIRSEGSYTLWGSLENLTLVGSSPSIGTGNTANNILTSSLAGDSLIGGAGDDTYIILASGISITENANEGVDTVQAGFSYTLTAVNVENLTLTGVFAINGTGNTDANTIRGNGAANILDGGAGDDTLIGGQGNDTYVVDSLNDIIVENAFEGDDTIESSISYVLTVANVEHLTLTGTGSIDGTGNAFNNVLTGNSGANILDGGTGIDIMRGGDGDDTYIVDNVSDLIFEFNNAGIDTVQVGMTYTLGSNLENLTLTGSSAINGTGNALDNVIRGNSAANNLSGGDGNDTFIVGHNDGNDMYTGGNGWDVLDFTSVNGVVQINQLNGITTGSAGNDTLLDTFEQISGSNFDDVLSGGHGINCLDGNGGNDMFFGNGGDDLLRGGDGNDIIFCNLMNDGDDRWLGGNGFDTIDYSSLGGAVQVNQLAGTTTGAAGNDTFLDSFEQIIGSAFADTITGDGNANTLKGNGGNDIINGGDGDDIIIATQNDGNDTYTGGTGFDTIDYSTVSSAVQVNMATGTATGAAGTDTFLDSFEQIIGSNFGDTITGDGNANTFKGLGGNDTISGGDGDDFFICTLSDGNDTYTGGLGWDILDFTSVSGVVQINQLTGTTTGSAGADILLDTFEQISGSNFDDVLSGGHGINCLDGNGGNDMFFGNGGDDLLRGGDGNDTIMCNLVSDGDDRWLGGNDFDTVDYSTLGGAVQVNQTTGATTGAAGNDTFLDVFERIIGSNFADTLIGEGGANTLWGGGGADTIQGKAGADSLLGGAGNDTFIFTTGDGGDTIGDFVAGAGSDDVINLHAMAGFTNFAQVQAVASQVGANTVLTFGGGDTITLTNVTAATLHQDDFIFV